MHEQAEAFGWNSTYLDDLPLQAQSAYPEDMDAAQTALSGFGQSSVTSTPLQMAMVVAAVANGGIVMRPYVVDEVRSPELDVLDKTERSPLSRAVSASTAEELKEMLVSTVDNGTASPAAIPGRRGRREDRNRRERTRRRAAVRLVRVVRARRRPAGRGGGDDPEGRHPAR